MPRQTTPRRSKTINTQKTQCRIQHSRWGPSLPGLRSPKLRKSSLRKVRVVSRKPTLGDENPVYSGTEECPEANPAGGEAHPMEENLVVTVTFPEEEETQRTEESGVPQYTQTALDLANSERLHMSAFLDDYPNGVRRSIRLPNRFCWVVKRPSFLQDLEKSYVVVVLFDNTKNKLHIKGEKENAIACLFYVKTLLAGWRLQEKKCAEGNP